LVQALSEHRPFGLVPPASSSVHLQGMISVILNCLFPQRLSDGKKRKIRAAEVLTSFASDVDLVADWFYWDEKRDTRLATLLLISCIVSTLLWFLVASSGRILRPFTKTANRGFIMFLGILLEDVPQIMLTFLTTEEEECGGYESSAILNLITAGYDILIKVTDAWDSRKQSVHVNGNVCWSKELSGHSNFVLAVAKLSEKHVVSGSSDKKLKLWDTTTGQCIQTFKGHKDDVNAVAKLSEKHVVSGSSDKTLKLWDTTTGQCIQTLKGHRGWVSAVAKLSEKHIVSGSHDSTLKLWDTTTGQCLRTLEGHEWCVTAVAKLSEKQVVSCSWDETLKLWDIDLSS